MPERILVECANPNDASFEDVQALAAAIERSDDEIEAVPFRREERGYGVSPSEVFRVWVDLGAAGAPAIAIAKALGWIARAREWLERRHAEDVERHPEERARDIYLQVAAPADGTVEVVIKVSSTGTEFLHGDDLPFGHPLPPPGVQESDTDPGGDVDESDQQ
jgi:hypothetical protein